MLDIDKLVAGQELDHLIAEKVMGVKVKSREGRHRRVYDLVIPGGVNHVDYVTVEGAWSACPKYSTDIAAAWQVLEKFPWFRIDNRGDYQGNEAFMVEINDDVKNRAGKMWGPTAPLAICLAALRAVGA